MFCQQMPEHTPPYSTGHSGTGTDVQLFKLASDHQGKLNAIDTFYGAHQLNEENSLSDD